MEWIKNIQKCDKKCEGMRLYKVNNTSDKECIIFSWLY